MSDLSRIPNKRTSWLCSDPECSAHVETDYPCTDGTAEPWPASYSHAVYDDAGDIADYHQMVPFVEIEHPDRGEA